MPPACTPAGGGKAAACSPPLLQTTLGPLTEAQGLVGPVSASLPEATESSAGLSVQECPTMPLCGLVVLCTHLNITNRHLLSALCRSADVLSCLRQVRRPEGVFSGTTVSPKSTPHGTMRDFSQNLVEQWGKDVVCGAKQQDGSRKAYRQDPRPAFCGISPWC